MRNMFRKAALICLPALAALSPGMGHAGEVPQAVAAGDARPLISLRGEGVQIYECTADPAGGGYVWTFREPLAILIKDSKTVGRHFAGPSWQLDDGGTVTGKPDGKAPGATDKDVPLLKFSVATRQGNGVLTQATVIQRLDTDGGVFSGSCSTPGALHLEPYTAQYVFSAN